jgi:hypothetical protein
VKTNAKVQLATNTALSAKTGNTPTFTLDDSNLKNNLNKSPPYNIEIKSVDTTASQTVSVVAFSLDSRPEHCEHQFNTHIGGD